MPDETNELHATLARLREQLGTAGNVTPETRAKLHRLLEEIHDIVETEGSGAPAAATGGESILSRLTDAEREFEATHPTIAGVISRLIDGLGEMGI